MHIPQPEEIVQTVDDKYGIATGRTGRWEEHYEIDLGDQTVFLHSEDIREVDR